MLTNKRVIYFSVFAFLIYAFIPTNPFLKIFQSPLPVETISDLTLLLAQPPQESNIKWPSGITRERQGLLIFEAPSGEWIGSEFAHNSPEMTTIHVSAWLEGSGILDLSIQDLTDGRVKTLSDQSVIRHRDIDLTPFLKRNHRYRLALFYENEKNRSRILLQELAVKRIKGIPFFPRLDTFLVGLLVCFLLFPVLMSRFKSRIAILPLTGLFAFLILSSSGVFMRSISAWFWISALFIVIWIRKRSMSQTPGSFNEFLLLIGAVAFTLRCKLLSGTMGQGLEGDAGGYLSMARTLSFSDPFLTGVREPLYIWLQKAMLCLAGDGEFSFRLVTLVLSVGVVILTYYLAKLISGNSRVGVGAAALTSVGKFYVFNSVRGERSELFVFLLLAFCIALLAIRSSNWKSEILLGLLAGLVSLTWLIGCLICVLAYGCRVIGMKVKWKSALLFFCALGFMVAPHLFFQWKQSGDPLHSINFATNFYRGTRLYGEPSDSEEKRSLGKYIFVEEGPHLLKNTLKGYFDLFLNPKNNFNRVFLGFHYSENKSFFLYPFLIWGLWCSVYGRKIWIFALMLSVLNVSVAFLQDVYDPRLFLQGGFFIVYFWGVGFERILWFIQTHLPNGKDPVKKV